MSANNFFLSIDFIVITKFVLAKISLFVLGLVNIHIYMVRNQFI